MAIREILIWPDSRLLQISEPVKVIDQEVLDLIKDMKDTVAAVNGLGLAAIQIGVPKRVILFQAFKKMIVAINPEIVGKADLQGFKGEGCLSLPGETFDTQRYDKVTLRSYGVEDISVFYDCHLSGLEAVEVQHELDHLNGKLLVARPEIGPMRRDIIRRRMMKYKRAKLRMTKA